MMSYLVKKVTRMKLTNKEEKLLKLKMLMDESVNEDMRMSAYEDLIYDSE